MADDFTPAIGDEFKVKVIVTPKATALTENHLLIVQVSYDDTPKAQVYDTKPILDINNQEVIEFTHKVESPGALNIKAMVWSDWPSLTEESNQLLNSAEVNYEIQ